METFEHTDTVGKATVSTLQKPMRSTLRKDKPKPVAPPKGDDGPRK